MNERMEDWRERMSNSAAVSEDELDELEAHLTDSMTELTAGGLSEEEAFAVARIRLGREDDLAEEYAKVNGVRAWLRRAKWMLIGTLVLQVFFSFLQPVTLWMGSWLLNPDKSYLAPVRYFVAPVYVLTLGSLGYAFRQRLVALMMWAETRFRRRPLVALVLLVLLCSILPLLTLAPSFLMESVRRLFLQPSIAPSIETGSLLVATAGRAANAGAIAGLAWWLHIPELGGSASGRDATQGKSHGTPAV